MKKEKSQKTRVMNHLKRYGKIDPFKAWNYYGVYRLASVICRLRNDGYELDTVNKPVINKYGEQVFVAEYHYGR